ncbi:MAG: DUF2782 domain-containing protein [Betaproteobacteria bacterium]|nr:DUF2782 domain-containing protein [Betaproteobacteria bacterium]
MRRLIALCLVAVAVQAQGGPPQPAAPAGSGERVEEPAVRIPVQQGDEVEPVRVGGQVVALRVKPKNGPVYYLVDTSGQGNWMRRESLDDGLRVPMFPIKTWD